MTRNEALLIVAAVEERDDQLVAAAAAWRPRRVTVLIPGDDRDWGWSDERPAAARRDRLARLLTAVEHATGASVAGLVGDPEGVQAAGGFDAVIGGHRVTTAA